MEFDERMLRIEQKRQVLMAKIALLSAHVRQQAETIEKLLRIVEDRYQWLTRHDDGQV